MKNSTKTYRFFYLSLAFSLITLMGFTCESDYDSNLEYDFEIGIKISPEQEIYKVGDTILLTYRINNNRLIDTKTGKIILLGKTSIPFNMYLGKRYIDNTSTSTENVFSVEVNNVPDSLVNLKQHVQFTDLRYHLDCEITQGNFQAEIVCVLEKSGIYKFEVWGNKSVFYSGVENCQAQVPEQNYADLSYKFDVTSTNIQLMEESPLPPNIIGDTSIAKTNNKEIFWIKVID